MLKETHRLEGLWAKEKHRYIYDPFTKELDFRFRRPTDYKLNKRVSLPKPLNDIDEFQCELKRRNYSMTFEEYIKENIKSDNKKESKHTSQFHENKRNKSGEHILNLSFKEREGLKMLNDRIDSGEIMITPTDKSGRFAVLTTAQYLESGKAHTSKDQKIGWKELNYMKNQVNNHMYWYRNIFNYSDKTNPDRMSTNLITSDLQLPEMAILVQDHKTWDFDSGAAVPSRPIVSGNSTINTHLSELISEIVEPLALNMNGCEIQSSEEALSLIDKCNEQITEPDRHIFQNSTSEMPQQFLDKDRTSNTQEQYQNSTYLGLVP